MCRTHNWFHKVLCIRAHTHTHKHTCAQANRQVYILHVHIRTHIHNTNNCYCRKTVSIRVVIFIFQEILNIFEVTCKYFLHIQTNRHTCRLNKRCTCTLKKDLAINIRLPFFGGGGLKRNFLLLPWLAAWKKNKLFDFYNH